MQQHAVRAEDVDETEAGASHDIVLLRILLRVGDKEIVVDKCNAEGGKARGNGRIAEVAIEHRQREVLVVDFDCAGKEVGGEEEGAVQVGAEGQAFVDGTALRIVDDKACGREAADDGIGCGIPGRDRAVPARPNEDRRPRDAVGGNREVRGRVPDHARGRRSRRRDASGRQRDHDLDTLLHAMAVIERRETVIVVRNPKWPAREGGDAPGILQSRSAGCTSAIVLETRLV